jgi:hypothetical protein
MDTLLLDRTTWDWVLDAQGNIAVAYYDTTKGIPFFTAILGQLPPTSLMKKFFVNAALTVPGVVSAVAFLSSLDLKTRQVTGQVQIKDATQSVAANIFVVTPPPAAVIPAVLPDVSVLNASVS